MTTDDAELIQAYATAGSQAAFAELVSRYVDLVYSAAVRQVRSGSLAEEVAQSVFIALAQHGGSIKSGTPLAAWLYLVTRRTAIDLLRREARRQARDHAAFEIDAMKSNSTWSCVEPLLDEAMEALSETDRTAIVLRYFESKSLREVGAALRTSEDAAQKRVSRAIEQLRSFFARRGVTVAASALATDLAAGAVQAAPVGLGVAISSAVSVSGAIGAMATAQAFKIITMTTIQKTFVGAAVVAFVGVGFYAQRTIARQQRDLRELRDQQSRLIAENRQLRQDRNEDAQLLRAADSAIAAVRSRAGAAGAGGGASGDSAMEGELKAVSARMAVLKERIARSPDQQIPELRLLREQDWINAAAKHKLDSDGDVAEALRSLRTSGKFNFSELAAKALWKFAQANEGRLPTDILELAPCFDPPIEAEMLQRYGIVQTGTMRELSMDTSVIAEVVPEDANRDPRLYMSGPRTQPNQGNVSVHSGAYSDISGIVLGAVAEFVKARGDQPLTDPAQLQRFLRAPVDPARLKGFWKAVGLPNEIHSPRD